MSDEAGYNIGCRGVITSRDRAFTLNEALAIGAISLAVGLTGFSKMLNDEESRRQRQAQVRVEETIKQLHESECCTYIPLNVYDEQP